MAITAPALKTPNTLPASTPSALRFDGIDALRGLAAVMVVVHHCCGSIKDTSWLHFVFLGVTYHPLRFFSYGYIGVDLFFVLSGFCLSWPFLARAEKPFVWKTYAVKRFRRIYPAYFITFVLLLTAGWLCRRYSPHLAHVAFAERLTAGQILASLALQMTHLNPAFWTLCLEWRWYVLFPFVMLFARKWSAWFLLPFAVIVSLLTPAVQTGILSPLKLMAYLPCFVAGVIAAEVHARPDLRLNRRIRRLALPGALLSFLVCVMVIPTVTPAERSGFHESLPTTGLFFFAVLLALESRQVVFQPWKAIQLVGLFSYSLYLIHLPLISLASFVLQTMAWSPPVQTFFWLCAFPPALIFLAYLFFQFAEKPFLEQSGSAKVFRFSHLLKTPT